MTRRDILQTAHEPFGDAFYYGPERLSKRFEDDEDARVKSGFVESTYRTVMDRLDNDGQQEVRSVLFSPRCILPARREIGAHHSALTNLTLSWHVQRSSQHLVLLH